ncbi:MAG: PhnD/SsuA/transferrin family substrate-binding protein, partial [Betaproteobacteria bacterium]
LARDGIAFTPQYVKSHENVYRAVILGDALAGGGVNNTLAREPGEVRDQLRVLMRTPNYMPHPFSAHPRVPASFRTVVTEAFMQMAQDESLKTLLHDIQISQPVKVDYVRDYYPLDQLGLGKFVEQ